MPAPSLRRILSSLALSLLLPAAIAGIAAAAEPAAAPAAAGDDSFIDLLFKGGWLMWPIFLCSVIGLAFIFERLVTLRRNSHLPRALFDEVAGLARGGEVARAETLCRGKNNALARVLGAVLVCEGGSRADMEMAIENEGGRVLWDLRRNAKVLGVLAGIAPLLGLLGTVFGMIRAFETYANAGGSPRPDTLAVGIYVALITTAAGLTVAIPCLFFFHYFRGKADTMVREMEERALELVHILQQRRRPARGEAE